MSADSLRYALRYRDLEEMMLGRGLHVNHTTIYFAFAVFLLLLSSCMTPTGRENMAKCALTEADKGRSFQVHQGDEIVINLKENPTTGYRWAVDKTDDEVLALQSSDFSLTPGGGVGGGGTRTLTFKAKKPGTVHLQLKLWRDWEGASSIIECYDVTLLVQ